MSERTPMEALRSALRFAASRSCITSAEELAIMDAWNNTRPQPSAEPVAYLYEREGCKPYVTANRQQQWVESGSTEETLVRASALEAARREGYEQAMRELAADTAWLADTLAKIKETPDAE